MWSFPNPKWHGHSYLLLIKKRITKNQSIQESRIVSAFLVSYYFLDNFTIDLKSCISALLILSYSKTLFTKYQRKTKYNFRGPWFEPSATEGPFWLLKFTEMARRGKKEEIEAESSLQHCHRWDCCVVHQNIFLIYHLLSQACDPTSRTLSCYSKHLKSASADRPIKINQQHIQTATTVNLLTSLFFVSCLFLLDEKLREKGDHWL